MSNMLDLDARQPIETAPTDGTIILARIPGHGDYLICAHPGFDDDDGNTGWLWVTVDGEREPKGWTDGACWSLNEDGEQSPRPTHWRPATRDYHKP